MAIQLNTSVNNISIKQLNQDDDFIIVNEGEYSPSNKESFISSWMQNLTYSITKWTNYILGYQNFFDYKDLKPSENTLENLGDNLNESKNEPVKVVDVLEYDLPENCFQDTPEYLEDNIGDDIPEDNFADVLEHNELNALWTANPTQHILVSLKGDIPIQSSSLNSNQADNTKALAAILHEDSEYHNLGSDEFDFSEILSDMQYLLYQEAVDMAVCCALAGVKICLSGAIDDGGSNYAS